MGSRVLATLVGRDSTLRRINALQQTSWSIRFGLQELEVDWCTMDLVNLSFLSLQTLPDVLNKKQPLTVTAPTHAIQKCMSQISSKKGLNCKHAVS